MAFLLTLIFILYWEQKTGKKLLTSSLEYYQQISSQKFNKESYSQEKKSMKPEKMATFIFVL